MSKTHECTESDGNNVSGYITNGDLPPVEFQEEKLLKPCSFAECVNGHQWKPTFALVECPGCHSPALMGKMENCPFCNEPTVRVSLRSDHLPKGGGVAKRCQGQIPPGETMDIELSRNHWQEIEGKEFQISQKNPGGQL